jgi:hypothetical protein
VLVYGDRAQTRRPRELLGDIAAGLRAAEQAAPGPSRHDLLIRAFIEAAGLAQGVADAEFEQRGLDDLSPAQDAAMSLLVALARGLAASASSGFRGVGPTEAWPRLRALAALPLPEPLRIRSPEGFAFYAVYPEAYLKAAAEHPWPAPPLVIGLRSIGAGLAALVAAAAAARKTITLRPCGPPFGRELKVSRRIRVLLAAHAGPFAIVDEGPGLSGSSFGATLDLLADLGVSEDRIVCLPSHAGEAGPRADPRRRARWARLARPVAGFEEVFAGKPLSGWFCDLTGEIGRVEDLSGGAWRRDAAGEPPPAHTAQERLKFRLHAASGRWLAKFAGLDAGGEARFERARALHRAGFSPEPAALRHGFLLERWEDAAPLGQLPRARLVEQLAAYLAFRAAAFPAEPWEGASREQLVEMARVNALEALGEAAAGLIAGLAERAAAAAPPGRPVHVDARLHLWEWRRTPDGRLLKTDAVDHSAAHDLVGCQDIAWDVAGAALEFGLAAAEVGRLCAAIEAATGQRPSPAALAFFDLCYPAFQAGYWRMAEAVAAPEERVRLAAQAARYEGRLARLAAAAESGD